MQTPTDGSTACGVHKKHINAALPRRSRRTRRSSKLRFKNAVGTDCRLPIHLNMCGAKPPTLFYEAREARPVGPPPRLDGRLRLASPEIRRRAREAASSSCYGVG